MTSWETGTHQPRYLVAEAGRQGGHLIEGWRSSIRGMAHQNGIPEYGETECCWIRFRCRANVSLSFLLASNRAVKHDFPAVWTIDASFLTNRTVVIPCQLTEAKPGGETRQALPGLSLNPFIHSPGNGGPRQPTLQ